MTKPAERRAEIDRHVANRIRERWQMLGISQREFGRGIGVSYRQAYKYERGLNKISASMLYEVAMKLKVSVDYFFQPLGGILEDRRLAVAEMVRNFSGIRNEQHQTAFSDLVRALAEADTEKSSCGRRL